jgi:hypothetical protein
MAEETPEERQARALRQYENQGRLAALFNPADPYSAADHEEGSGK